jgi:uncharacterized repeat protein (TIGR01451 family)
MVFYFFRTVLYGEDDGFESQMLNSNRLLRDLRAPSQRYLTNLSRLTPADLRGQGGIQVMSPNSKANHAEQQTHWTRPCRCLSGTLVAFMCLVLLPGAMAQSSDYGDAPEPGYPTSQVNDGARHILGSRVYLGQCVDGEDDGLPSAEANGDDNTVGGIVWGDCEGDDDEDGVNFPALLAVGTETTVEVFAAFDCTLSAWIDFAGDGDWDDPEDELFPGGIVLSPGLKELTFVIPGTAIEGTTWARFRCTSDGPVSYTGEASDGEVEDYQISLGLPADYGDAPDPSYPTLKASDGAKHVLVGSDVYLGSCVDADDDGRPTATADGDDTLGSYPQIGGCTANDDEDGVNFTSELIAGTTATIDVEASAACTLSAWVDFNADGDWDEADDELFPGGQALVAGVNSLSFDVPAGAVAGLTFSRFRCTTDGAVTFNGSASDGEVEDHPVIIDAVSDFGDAPDPSYPTLLASTGASHTLGGDVYLGSCVDADIDGQTTGGGDDRAAGNPVFGTCEYNDDDEDGVQFTSPLVAGMSATVDVEANADCTLSAWIDFDANGDWSGAGEELFTGGTALTAGVNSLSFDVPLGSPSGYTYARFRCTTDGAVSFDGAASDGEVEDYGVYISDIDFGDAPDPTYPTLQASDGAMHRIGGRVYLGTCVDGEQDGQQSAAADGDDTAVGDPVVGVCNGDNDEDGVNFLTPLYPDASAEIQVFAREGCTLSAWIDFNADGDWADTGEDIFPGGTDVSQGSSFLSFPVPDTAVVGTTHARFRCTTEGAVSYTGYSGNGEVEDYQVTIETPRDWGDWQYYSLLVDPVFFTSDGARHILGSDVYLGACVDAEIDGQPSPLADTDDLVGSPWVKGACSVGDDEDGVVFTSLLLPNATATVDVTASAACTLSAWIDFDGNGFWSDTGNNLFPGGVALSAGINSLSFTVPAFVGSGGPSRFRCTTDGAVSYTGEASDGEVEDHWVAFGEVNDFGDAPDPGFPTLAASTGASHILGSGVFLGACVDPETDGQPSEGAVGDDILAGNPYFGTCTGSDEDGVVPTSAIVPGRDAYFDVTATAACTLSAWIDFNGDGDWDETNEQLYPSGQALSAGVNNLAVPVPADAVLGSAYARFRCTTDGVVGYSGQASDGEVEDYQLLITNIEDWGDAPAPYPTTAAENGANHLINESRSLFLGSCIDGDSFGLPTPSANGDDLAPGLPVYGSCVGDDDEDGVVFAGSLLPGSTADLQITAGGACTLSAWLDYNGDGDWDDSDEDLFPGGQLINGGNNQLSITVPAGATVGSTYARFRCTTDGAVSYVGQASDGEVEDYQVTIGTAIDYGDAPDPTYPTTAASSGASHVLTDSVYLGACVDAEEDGQPAAETNGDDINGGNPVFGTCTGIGDEDGVSFMTPLTAGETAEIEVSSVGVCTLSAWIDFNADGDWDDAGEAIFPSGAAVIPDRVTLSFDVPATAVSGTTVARFRCTTDGVVSYTGQASDGEVEDYEVAISYLDFGDAPDPSYDTLLASDGARHGIRNQVYLGACIDGEADGQPTTAADGDDTTAGLPEVGDCSAADDEDGVTFTDDLIIGNTVSIDVQASASCTLSAWIDFNADGDWDDAGEDLFPGGQPVVMGSNSLSLVVPADAVTGDTYARFRCTTDGAVATTGAASDGEVEDYQVVLRPAADYGDAPDPTYPTLFASDGARHKLGSGNVYLGSCVDAETDGQPATAADGDDLNPGDPVSGTCSGVNGDDEDGVIFTSLLLTDSTADVDVTASAACTLSAWIDFNADGDWDDVDDELFPGGTALAAGVNSLSFSVPAGAVEGATYARFRCTTDGAVSYTGEASDGEVEDYQIVVGPAADWGDAVDPTYPTLSASSGASHLLGSGVYLGACVDVELDGYQSALADGDDLAAGAQVFGTCTSADDEDGVVFTSLVTAGATVTFDVTASADCALSAWIDFNGDGDWDEVDDELFPGGTALVAGVNSLSIAAPLSVVTGTSNARFRCTTDGAVSYTDQASDGEVEDHQVIIGEAWDWGDAPSNYPTIYDDDTPANSGASHMLGSGIYLGSCVDAEADGNPSEASDGDDLTAGNPVFGSCTGSDDEDGVVFTSDPIPGQTAGVDVTASAGCTLSAWIDFNGDGDWDETGEDLFPGGTALVAGINSLTYSVPEAAEVIGDVFSRFRCTTVGAVLPTGQATDGEVEDHVVTIPPPAADLSITKTDGVTTAAPGGSVTYTIVASNAGPYNVIGGSLMDAFPTGFSCTWTCVGSGGAVCTAGPETGDILDTVDIPLGGIATYTATCTIPSSTTGTIVNTASVSAPGYTDPNGANNSATDDDTVLVPEADLEISKVDDVDPVGSGDYLTYTVTVLNNGPSSALSVTVNDTLPAEATFVATSGCAEDPDGYPDCSLGTIAAGDSAQYTITTGIAFNTSGTITNSASVSSATADPNAANDSTSEDTEVLDLSPPEVTLVDSVAGTGDGQLDECETVIGSVSQLLVTFSEAISDPAGDSDADDVTNPSNYMVVSAGADRILDTSVCGAVAGDDVEVTIAGVTYDAPTTTATVTLGGALGPARHRLLVCGSTSVTDLGGNPLDGNADGTGGDDFIRTFRTDPNNLLVNAYFDCDLAAWTLTSATPGEIEHSTLDYNSSAESGSVHLQQLALDTEFEISQCVGAYASMFIGGRIQISTGAYDYLSYTRSCEFFDQPDCSGSSLNVNSTTLLLGDTAGEWLEFNNAVSAPLGTSSARCAYKVNAPAGEDFDAWLDNLILIPGVPVIFSDGFESGDTSAWSSTFGN